MLFSQNFSSYPIIHCHNHWITEGFVQVHCACHKHDAQLYDMTQFKCEM